RELEHGRELVRRLAWERVEERRDGRPEQPERRAADRALRVVVEDALDATGGDAQRPAVRWSRRRLAAARDRPGRAGALGHEAANVSPREEGVSGRDGDRGPRARANGPQNGIGRPERIRLAHEGDVEPE